VLAVHESDTDRLGGGGGGGVGVHDHHRRISADAAMSFIPQFPVPVNPVGGAIGTMADASFDAADVALPSTDFK
jgi:hypothetical protein